VIIDDHDPRMQYNGQWGNYGSSPEYLSTTRASRTRGDMVTFTFEGTSVGVFGTVGAGNGATMEFSLDHSPNSSFSAPPSISGLFHQPLWTSGVLFNELHTLSIT
ncbi:hypothetical protein B0H17DRAFT_886048, partial [Mycena rosella]